MKKQPKRLNDSIDTLLNFQTQWASSNIPTLCFLLCIPGKQSLVPHGNFAHIVQLPPTRAWFPWASALKGQPDPEGKMR